MPSMISITVKKKDGTTDAIYAVKNPAGGDNNWAEWLGPNPDGRPRAGLPLFAVRTSESKAGVRRVDVKYKYPYVYSDSTTGQAVISPLAVTFQNGVWTVPQGVPQAVVDEAGAQFSNLFGHATIKSVLYDQSAFN